MLWLVCKSETDISAVIFKITRSINTKAMSAAFYL